MRLRRSARQEGTTPEPAGSTPAEAAIQYLAARPGVDRLLTRLLQRPRVLQIVAFVLTQALIVAFLLRGIWSSPTPPTQPAGPTALQERSLHTTSQETTQQEILALLASYNQASISAGLLNRAELLLPYLAPDGLALAEVRTEYQRRQQLGETHETALVRWGLVRSSIEGDIAEIEMQEEWDDATLVGGVLTSSYRGLLVRNTYTLRRSPQAAGGWLITQITSDLVIQ